MRGRGASIAGDSSLAKSTGRSLGGPGSNSQHLYGCSQLAVTTSPGLTPPSGLLGDQTYIGAQIDMKAKHPHTLKSFIFQT